MTQFIHTDENLDFVIAELVKADPRFAPILREAGRPPLRLRDGGFPGLAAIVVSQQLSTASASAIWGRLAAAYDPFEASAIRRARPERLARLGLSAPKIRALKEIAKAVDSGALALNTLGSLEADAAHAALTAVHGIGPWTADIYLLFCLGHADAWPAGDLAIQESMRVAFNLKARPNAKEAIVFAESWRPWRGAAAYLLWSYYHVAKGRSGTPTAEKAKAAKAPTIKTALTKPKAVQAKTKTKEKT